MKYVLDASAILRFLQKETGWADVAKILKQANAGGAELLISAVNWGEVLHVVLKSHGSKVMNETDSTLQMLPFNIVPVDSLIAKRAAEFRFQFKIPFADAFAGALAKDEQAILMTADHDLLAARGKIKIHFLAAKPKP